MNIKKRTVDICPSLSSRIMGVSQQSQYLKTYLPSRRDRLFRTGSFPGIASPSRSQRHPLLCTIPRTACRHSEPCL